MFAPYKIRTDVYRNGKPLYAPLIHTGKGYYIPLNGYHEFYTTKEQAENAIEKHKQSLIKKIKSNLDKLNSKEHLSKIYSNAAQL